LLGSIQAENIAKRDLEVEKRRVEFELQSEQQSKRRLEKEYQQLQKALQTERESRLFTQAAKARSEEQLQLIKRSYETERDNAISDRSSLDIQDAYRDVESAKLKVGESLQLLKSQLRRSPAKSPNRGGEFTFDELHSSQNYPSNQGYTSNEIGLAEAEAIVNRARISQRRDAEMYGHSSTLSTSTRNPTEDLHAAQAKVNDLLQLLQQKPTL
jgi:hypothetical protein